MKITVGCDTEFFIHNGKKIIPVGGGVCPGTKEKPFATGDGFFAQEDGASVEVNTPYGELSPEGVVSLSGGSRYTFSELVGTAVDKALRLIHDRANDTSVKVSQSARARLNMLRSTVDRLNYPEHDFSEDELKLAGPSVFVVGCDPDFSAYSPGGTETNTIVDYTELGGTRMAGGHIHIGYDKAVMPEQILVQFMDLFSARYQLLSSGGMRSKYYGKPGNFRRKPYGIEYRSLTTRALLIAPQVTSLLRRVHQLLHNIEAAREFFVEFNWTEFRDNPFADKWVVKADELFARLDDSVAEAEAA